MIVLCASCGWRDEESSNSPSFRGASHLRSCPKRDDLRYVPWWTTRPTNFSGDIVLEVGWHPLDVNEPDVVVDHFGPLTATSDPGRYVVATHTVTPPRRHRFTAYTDRELIGVTP